MLSLHINDLFFTIQGEGANAGRSALFVRMPYCNLACSWCDTQFNEYKNVSQSEFITYASSLPIRFAVITGGEPMMHKHTPRVVELLKKIGYEIACETNGTFPIVDGIDFVTVSPKRDAEYKVNAEAWAKASEFKYVVDEGFDFKILDRHDTKDGRRYSLSPEFGQLQEKALKIAGYIAMHPDWRMSLQTHKFIGVK
jgi:organic radical activating enzyme